MLGGALVLCIVMPNARPATAADRLPGFNPQRHMALDEIKPDMRGYGMSVFSGTTPEPFAVEVLSVASANVGEPAPGKSVIWIRCPGERMQKSGPVAGMSGSPIFLWDEGAEDAQLGEGGRIIGAFAYGYTLSKDCYVGVQPIEQMIEAASRQRDPDTVVGYGGDGGRRLMSIALAQAADQKLPDHQTWRLQALARLLGVERAAPVVPARQGEGMRASAPMPLPVSVHTAAHAAWLNPYLKQTGVQAFAMAGGAAAPPPWIDGERVRFEPGGMVSLPMISGDMDLSGSGTVTDILDTGQLLLFGHAMYNEGPMKMPIATCYVHFVMPTLSRSFKVSGTIDVRGSMVHDEVSAVVAVEDHRVPMTPVTVTTHRPADEVDRTFHYEIVRHPYLSPVMAAYAAIFSMTTDSYPPMDHTIAMRTRMQFSGGRELYFDDVMPLGGQFGPFFQIMPAISALAFNEFEPVTLEKLDVDMTVREKIELAEMVNVTVRQSELEAGQTLVALVEVRPFRQEPVTHQIEFELPRDLPEGNYTITLGGPNVYLQQLIQARPHLGRIENVDDLHEMIQWVAKARSDALYAVARIQKRSSVAVGRTELPKLPSSRAAILNTTNSTRTSTYVESLQAIYDMPYVIDGQATIQISVSEPRPRD
ncbi:MAG: hypothetical protein CMJ49_07420 [Planctomycetaceae bacterium]|nr:hypothetical protein [Planctomycetaceae bacterium]